MYKEVFEVSGSEAYGEISLADLPSGVLLSVIEVSGRQINAKKFLVKYAFTSMQKRSNKKGSRMTAFFCFVQEVLIV